MSAKILENIRQDALSLPLSERAELARELVASLDGPADLNAGEEWDKEICRRINEIRSDQAVLLDSDEVISRIRTRLNRT